MSAHDEQVDLTAETATAWTCGGVQCGNLIARATPSPTNPRLAMVRLAVAEGYEPTMNRQLTSWGRQRSRARSRCYTVCRRDGGRSTGCLDTCSSLLRGFKGRYNTPRPVGESNWIQHLSTSQLKSVSVLLTLLVCLMTHNPPIANVCTRQTLKQTVPSHVIGGRL